MLGQGPVCHGEGQSTSLHLVTGDAINTNEYCLSLRLAALLGKSRIEISSAFLHGWEWLPPFSNHLFFPLIVDGWNPAPPEMYPKLSTGAESAVLRYNPSKPYQNLTCNRAQYRNNISMYPTVKCQVPIPSFVLPEMVHIYIYISNMVCMVLYALTGAFEYRISTEAPSGPPYHQKSHTSDEPTNSSARCLWMHQAFPFETAFVREKMSPFSWVAPRCFLESLRWETGW